MLRVESWYGLPAEIAVENGLWHLVRVGGIALGHPPLVNLILRRGLPEQARLELSFLHEYGHLQTLPIAAGHLLLLVLFGRWQRLGWREALARITSATIAHQAVWELASETYVLQTSRSRYQRIYRAYPNPWGQAIFWIGMTLLALARTAHVFRRSDR